MDSGVSLPQNVCSYWRASHRLHRLIVLSLVAVCSLHPNAAAQETGSLPPIRVEAGHVLVPVTVLAKISYYDPAKKTTYGWEDPARSWGKYVPVSQLTPRNFHLFVDGVEQQIDSANRKEVQQSVYQDNIGYEVKTSLAPKGMWTNLTDSSEGHSGKRNHHSALYEPDPAPFYLLVYRPSNSTKGSCHSIRIMVDAENGMVTKSISNDIAAQYRNSTIQIEAHSSLVLRYHTQYCNTQDAVTNPLFETPVGNQLERVASKKSGRNAGFFLNAFAHFDRSQHFRIHLALDFSPLTAQVNGIKSQVSLLGFFKRMDNGQASRFSDSIENGCFMPRPYTEESEIASACDRHSYFNHYETEASLPPGDYDLRIAIKFGGVVRSAKLPISIPAPTQKLAVSGIALCRRYFLHNQIEDDPKWPDEELPSSPPDPKPLVSNGIEYTPTGDTHFKAKDFMAVYFEVYEPLLAEEPLKGGDRGHVQFEIRIVDAKTGATKSDTGFRSADVFVNADSAVIPISAQVAIGELSPGGYRLQVRAKDSAGVETDWRTTSFTRE